MIIYIPYYTGRQWKILEADTSKEFKGKKQFRIFKNSLNEGFTVEYCNTLYNGIAYNDREYAEMYIVKNSKEWGHRIDFNQKEWDHYKQ